MNKNKKSDKIIYVTNTKITDGGKSMFEKFNETQKQELRKFAEAHGLRCLEKDFKFLKKAVVYYERLPSVNECNKILCEEILKMDPKFVPMSAQSVTPESSIPRKYLKQVRNAYYVSIHYQYDLEYILRRKQQ